MKTLRTPELVAHAKAMRAQGYIIREIAAALGVGRETIRGWINEEYRIRRQREKRHDRSQPSGDRAYSSAFSVEADAIRLAKLIPIDTRTDAERAIGDPIFERSALYRKQQGMRT